ncbi:Kinesin-like protein KIF26B [Merluccius polli]|uniref:Kinesin-like protein KIF26B n=1 Tax=Merluccius polli TaxID=89951 RepID=A0AA47MAU4_MERPO|nr:Kinesin-like protein KIF26B [Merluccius polli]
MTSLSGTKERSVTSRSRKYGVGAQSIILKVPDTSPTKSASFSPETWYRQAYEESSRGGGGGGGGGVRPAPEGAGSMPSSTGTPSPGSGTSSPGGSFSAGSPGTVSPGIGTESPGSLGGSPGFGTGSPASGSGSSPGSERGGWCENCNARLAELKRQALKLLIPGPYSSKDPSFSLLIHDKLQVPNSSRRAWNERDSRCDVCSTHLTQLKQEAVHMVLTLDHWDLSPTSSPTALLGRFTLQGPQGSAALPGAPLGAREWPSPFLPSSASSSSSSTASSSAAAAAAVAAASHTQPHQASNSPSPTPSQTPTHSQTPTPSHAPANPSHGSPSAGQTSNQAPFTPPPHQPLPPGSGHRLGSKPSSLGVGGAGDRRSASPSQGKAAGSQQHPGSGGNSHGNSSSGGAVLSTAALQAHQHLTRTSGGVTLYPYQISQMISEASREEMTEAALNRHNTHSPSHAHTNSHSNTNSPSHTPPVTTAAPTTATSTAASFFVRAAQKLNLASKKKKQKSIAAVIAPVTSSSPACDPPLFPTNFSSTLLVAPPPAPPCLLRAANKIKDTPGLGKVKVMVRVCPVSQSDAAESSSFLKVDPRKKQITIMEPSANQGTSKRAGTNQVPPKIFAFDAAFPHDASQAEVCAGTVAEVIQSVVNGADGCVFCFGHSKLGKSYTMIGRDDSLQTLGIIPCAISWLFKLINERKEKTGARFSVRVSAVEVWGKEENLKDLLSEVATGSLQDGQSPGVYLCEDPICGMQLQNQSELRAPTPEKAAWFLDAAIAARHSSQRTDTTEEEHRNSHMLFTLHIYQYRMEKTGKGGMSGGRSRLHLLDLGSCDVKTLIGGGAAAGAARGAGTGAGAGAGAGAGGAGKGKESSSTCPAPLCLSLSALGNVIMALVNGSKHIPYKDSKLTMLLRESLGNMNCRTTMIAHISASPRDFSETLFTIQIASRVLRMKKKKTKVTVQYTSSSSGGESSCEEGRMRRPTHLRPFHHRGDACDSALQLLRLSSDPDEYSSSEQSCDTVIYVGPNGAAVSDRELTDNEGPPEFVPIIPVLLRGKAAEQPQQPLPPPPLQSLSQSPAAGAQTMAQSQCESHPPPSSLPQPSQCLLGQPLPPVPEEGAECLKCNTFAELQERLDCIDGSEEVAKFPFEEVPPTTKQTKQDLDSASPVLESADPGSVPGSVPAADMEPRAGSKGAETYSSYPEDLRRRTNDQQLQEIRDVVEEAELAHTMIHSLAHGSGSSLVSSARSVTGSSCTTFNPLQRTKSSGLHDSRESLAGGVGESKTRPLGSPRLGIASLTQTSEYRPPSSPSQRCKVYTQKGVMPGTPPLSSHTLAQDGQAAEARQVVNDCGLMSVLDPADSVAADSVAADSGRSSTDSVLSRASPVGMSLQVREPTAHSLSASHGSAETLCDDEVPQIPLDAHREGEENMPPLCRFTLVIARENKLKKQLLDNKIHLPGHAGTLSPVGQLSLGEDELVFTMAPGGEVALEARAMLEARGLDGRPASMVSFTSDCCLVTARGSGPVPVSIISSIGWEAGHLEHYGGSAVTAARAGVTEVVAMAEVAMAKLRLEGEALTTVMPSCASSISSWLSDLSVGSEAEQSLHSFSQTQSQQGEALADPDPIHSLTSRAEGPGELLNINPVGAQRRSSQEGDMLLSESGSERGGGTPAKERLKTLPHSVGKTSMQALGRPGNFSPLRTTISVHPCLAVKPMMIQEPTILSSQMKSGFNKDLAKPGSAQAQGLLATISSEMNFEDPWLKRGGAGMRSEELACNLKAEMKRVEEGKISQPSPNYSKRAMDGCEMVVTQGDGLTSVYNPDIHRTASLPRGWHRVNRYDGLENSNEYRNLGVTTSTPCSPRATLDRRGCRQSSSSHKRGGVPPQPPVRKSSLDQRNRAAGPPLSPLHQPSYGLSFLGSSAADDMGLSGGSAAAAITRQRGASTDSGKLFSAKLEQLANRTNSLGRAHGTHSGGLQYDCFSLERGGSLRGGGGEVRGDSTMPRTGRSLTRAGSVSSPHGHASSSSGPGFISVPGTCSAPQSPAKGSSQSKISAVSKLLMASSPKSRSLSASSTKTLSISTKSLPQAFNRSSSLPPNAKPQAPVQAPVQQQSPSSGSWSTQSLSRSRGGSLAAKLPLRAVNGRISELLQGSASTRARGHAQAGGTEAGEEKGPGVSGASGDTGGGGAGGAGGVGGMGGTGGAVVQAEEKPAVVQTLPSPYSKITAPRKPHRCSSGHASDNSSVLSGELPPAMGKTALFYHSGGSSGYESMLRDSSENTGSNSSAQDSVSEHSSATTSSRRSSKTSKKSRSSTGLQRRRLIPALTLDPSTSSSPTHRSSKATATSSSSSSSSPSACWVDGPLGPPASPNPRGGVSTTESFEIKVYEIDDVERLQRRREKGSKEGTHVSAKLRLLEHRQQRITELRAKYQGLKNELEQTKQHLMLEPHQWTTEFELQQAHDDSLEYLEALEMVTFKLETRVNFCKAHLMMITCFDVSSKRR